MNKYVEAALESYETIKNGAQKLHESKYGLRA